MAPRENIEHASQIVPNFSLFVYISNPKESSAAVLECIKTRGLAITKGNFPNS